VSSRTSAYVYIPNSDSRESERNSDVAVARIAEERTSAERCHFAINDIITIHDQGISRPATSGGRVTRTFYSDLTAGWVLVVKLDDGTFRKVGVATVKKGK